MSVAIRIVAPIAGVLIVLALALAPAVNFLTEQWFAGEVELRTELIERSLASPIGVLLSRDDRAGIAALLDSLARSEADNLRGLAFCAADGTALQAAGLPIAPCGDGPRFEIATLDGGPRFLMARFPVTDGDGITLGRLVVVHDLDFVEQRSTDVVIYALIALIIVGGAVAVAALFLMRLALRRWARAMRESLAVAPSPAAGPALSSPAPSLPELGPLARDIQEMLRALDESRAGNEIRLTWTPETLRQILAQELPDADVIVVSNREPYIHNRTDDGGISLQIPASGLVAALEPITRACAGTWVAHGSGSADRDVVDAQDRVPVPPADPAYTLRRVWLTEEEQDGYYYGMANEGLWPLCHLAYVRPVFRQDDWNHYVAVNTRFADAVVAEAKSPRPIVLVQDYHFALLPRLIRQRLPEATIITFWHIPWPNHETFGICPWRAEILDGLLGSTILAFHTQFHCNNFLDGVDHYLESRIDREHATITVGGMPTAIRPYPISIEWPPAALAGQPPVAECRDTVRARHGIGPEVRLGVGVERFDFTKGIVDRFRAVGRLMELQPEWRGRFSFLQAAAPTRSKLPAYRQLEAEARAVAEEINQRFGTVDWQPIILVPRHHEPDEVMTLFRAADLCVVSSLHDGMNLVAKEFIAARDDGEGVLILSTFAGASRELLEALIINPYDTDSMAETLAQALRMPVEEQRERMRLMREMVRDNNVYRWAGRMLLDAARLRKHSRIDAGNLQPETEQRHGV